MHRNFQAASFQMALKRCAPQLSNCFPLNDSRDLYTATFKLLSSKWLLREMHRNFQTASFSMILEKYAPQLLNCFLLNDSWEICTTTLHCFLLNDSGYIYTATFKLLSSKWLLREMHRNFQTASFSMILEKYAPQLLNCFLLNDSWEICTTTLHCFLLNDSGYIYTATFKLLSFKWLLRYIHSNFHTAIF